MKSYNIYSDPQVAYCVGRRDVYDSYLARYLTPLKVGFEPGYEGVEPYAGGAVWRTPEEAFHFLAGNPAYGVYRLLLPGTFEACTVKDAGVSWHSLLYSALILKRVQNGV